MSKTYGKQVVYELLESNGIVFEKLEHEAVYTMENMEKEGIVEKDTVCKNLFLHDAKAENHYLVTVPEEKRVDSVLALDGRHGRRDYCRGTPF